MNSICTPADCKAEKRQEEAFRIFRSNYEKHPEQWFVHSGMARIYAAQHDFENAAKEMKLALSSAPEGAKSSVEDLVRKLEAKQNIN